MDIDISLSGKFEEKLVYVVLPIRVTTDRLDAIQRLDFASLDRNIPNNVQFVVVDDGSEASCANKVREKAEALGYSYIYINSASKPFSIGRCRNIAASYCPATYILFQDIDLLTYDGFYQSVLSEIKVQQLDRFIDRFLMFGVIYLTKNATDIYFELEPEIRKDYFLQKLIDNCEEDIEKFSTGTSVTLFNRDYFLIRGGNDPQFEKWGYEDLEFVNRCIRLNRIYPLPDTFELDYKNFNSIDVYKGWKSIYRLYGDRNLIKGKVLFHAWHPVFPTSDYTKGKERNQLLFNKKLKMFKKHGLEPDVLQDMHNPNKTLLFRQNPFVFQREFRTALGDIQYADENSIDGTKDFERFLIDNNITQVLFHNPYSTDKMIDFYNYCRNYNVDYFVAERGALPGSFFFDKNGFLADSNSFDEINWKNCLTYEQERDVISYFEELRTGVNTLEKQGDRECLNNLRFELGIKPHEKVLFVPLQRPGDTVIKYQIGDIGSYQEFINLVNETAEQLPLNWKIVIKKHPLEDEIPDMPNVLIASNSVHINDLIELSDSILLINSGVGLISMAWEKPLMYAGNAFYGHEKLNTKVSKPSDVIECLYQPKKPSWSHTLRFFDYLLNEYYSFGEFVTRETKMDDGTRMTATIAIRPKVIRGLISRELAFEYNQKPIVTANSILFDRYRRNGSIMEDSLKTQKSKSKVNNGSLIYLKKQTKGTFKSKFKKFRKNRQAFLRDSKYPFLRFFAK
ncbi:hypothetical protein C2869_19215 [Saccharobesus litoralis]|uniref:Glycosyltransferase 2-like prokaryotic type domain-containing protein n=1 Tax=Saccharobesus litoralis TaxID=2172099 RepID=A0A2S0VW06_9ALTE|nr:glycosyltransferase [Saccharobesus litoralis]AWB68404.1 hypothetical protein C2869_19215 [Saccharobesus litoralis]